MAQLFTGFSLVINPDAYSTDPVLKDTDGDQLSDFEEVVTGYTVTLTGELYQDDLILTDPNNDDSDGDGLTDYEEATLTNGYITNANDADTDGDGSDDFTEVNETLINPLVRDALVTVSYDSLFLGYMPDCGTISEDANGNVVWDECPTETNILWWLYGDGDDGVTEGNRILSSSDEFAYTPDGTVRPLASGHQRLIEGTNLNAGDLPTSTATTDGLLMEYSLCDTSPESLSSICSSYLPVHEGDRGYNPDVYVDWGRGGVPYASDDFMVKWTGEIFIGDSGATVVTTDPDTGVVTEDHVAATYLLQFRSDDGVRIKLNGTRVDLGSPRDDEWSLNANQVVSYEWTVDPGWKQIEIEYFEHYGDARAVMTWQPPGQTGLSRVPMNNLRHSLGNGAYSCMGIERDPTQTGFISLNRPVDMENDITPVAAYSPGFSYYGSVAGSEMWAFKQVVEMDISADLNMSSPNYRPSHTRYYIDAEVEGFNGAELTRRQVVSIALDLAASRNIIDGLVRPDASNIGIYENAEMKNDAKGDYFELSEAGRMLFQQLSRPEGVYGEQTFVVREGENINFSGVLMRIDDLESLSSCPIGSDNVVSQFNSGCMKRYSRSISYEEMATQSFMTLNLNNLLATTTSTSTNPADCEIDLDISITRH